MIIVGLIAIPYIDTNKNGNGYYIYNDRKFAYITFQYGFVVLWVVLILLGTFLRGPELELLRSVRVLGPAQADPAQQRQAFGHDLDPAHGRRPSRANYLVPRVAGDLDRAWATSRITPYLMYRFFFKKYAEQAGMLRYMTLAVLMLFMASLADQDGAALDDQPEVHRGDSGVLL